MRMQTATYVPGAKPEVPSSLGKIGLQDPARYSDGRLVVMVDRPGDLGASGPWEDVESCLHSGSSSAVHITAAEGGDGIPGVQDGSGTMRCSRTQLDLMGHDPKPAPR
jgi:hypothetical protein